ncbi:MAG: AAA family ATPase, partial [bacterium]|nr:AAA family ATPase [bacterium]
VLLDPSVEDPWGQRKDLVQTRVRYELQIRWHRHGGVDRLVVTREEVRPILSGKDGWPHSGRGMSPEFQRAYLRYGRRAPFLSNQQEGANSVFSIHQDGRSGRTKPAHAAGATILSSIRSSEEFPHLYALAQELASWRFLHLDPAALRGASSTVARDELDADGRNLPTVLNRLRAETATATRPQGVLAEISADLASMISGVLGIEVQEDPRAREVRIDLKMEGKEVFPSRVVSDGTLRVLGLLTVLHDPRRRGLLCYEEPENGIHPGRLKHLVRLLQESVTDPSQKDASSEEPLSQVLMNSHSPVVLGSLLKLAPETLLFADRASIAGNGAGPAASRTRIRPIHLEEQGRLLEPLQESVSSFEVSRFLETTLSAG